MSTLTGLAGNLLKQDALRRLHLASTETVSVGLTSDRMVRVRDDGGHFVGDVGDHALRDPAVYALMLEEVK